MKSTRRIVAAGLAVATMFGTLGLAGCGSNSGSEQESNPKTIKIWHYEEDNGAQGKAWAKAMEIFEKKTGVKVEFEKKSFEQIRQNAAQILNSDEAPDVMEYNKGNATVVLLHVIVQVAEQPGTAQQPERLREEVQLGQEGLRFFGRYR